MITYREVLGMIKRAGGINGQQAAAVGTNRPSSPSAAPGNYKPYTDQQLQTMANNLPQGHPDRKAAMDLLKRNKEWNSLGNRLNRGLTNAALSTQRAISDTGDAMQRAVGQGLNVLRTAHGQVVQPSTPAQQVKAPTPAGIKTSTRPGWVQVENGVWMPSQAAAKIKRANPNVQAQTANETYNPSARLREQKAFDKRMILNRNTAPSRGLTRSTGNTLVSPGLARPVNHQSFNRVTNYSPRYTRGRRY